MTYNLYLTEPLIEREPLTTSYQLSAEIITVFNGTFYQGKREGGGGERGNWETVYRNHSNSDNSNSSTDSVFTQYITQ